MLASQVRAGQCVMPASCACICTYHAPTHGPMDPSTHAPCTYAPTHPHAHTPMDARAYAGELPRDALSSLYAAGLVRYSVPVNANDRIAVPPLKGFVMNRVGHDYLEKVGEGGRRWEKVREGERRWDGPK